MATYSESKQFTVYSIINGESVPDGPALIMAFAEACSDACMASWLPLPQDRAQMRWLWRGG